MAVVSKVTVKGDLRSTISDSIAALGGIGSFVHSGDSVLLKPNFNSADPFPASTDISFLRDVVQIVLEQDPQSIVIGESSALNDNTSKIMDKLGVRQIEELSPKVRVTDLNTKEWTQKSNPQAQYLKKVQMPQILDRVDKLILLPCLKTHNLAQFSGSLKLSVAYMRRRERIALHIRRLQLKIAELNTYIQPDLIIMDARKCFINGGPYSGDVREPNLIMCSTDRVAIDLEGVRLIQSYPGNSLSEVDPLEMPQIKLSMSLGIGEDSLTEEIQV